MLAPIGTGAQAPQDPLGPLLFPMAAQRDVMQGSPGGTEARNAWELQRIMGNVIYGLSAENLPASPRANRQTHVQ